MAKNEGTDKQWEAAKETKEQSLVSSLYVRLASISEGSTRIPKNVSSEEGEKVFPAARATSSSVNKVNT